MSKYYTFYLHYSKIISTKLTLALIEINMDDETVNLTWQNIKTQRQFMFKELMETQKYSDITLVSDDQHQFKVHRFIISSCSTVLQNILDNNPENITVYLRGIHHEDLKSIVSDNSFTLSLFPTHHQCPVWGF